MRTRIIVYANLPLDFYWLSAKGKYVDRNFERFCGLVDRAFFASLNGQDAVQLEDFVIVRKNSFRLEGLSVNLLKSGKLQKGPDFVYKVTDHDNVVVGLNREDTAAVIEVFHKGNVVPRGHVVRRMGKLVGKLVANFDYPLGSSLEATTYFCDFGKDEVPLVNYHYINEVASCFSDNCLRGLTSSPQRLVPNLRIFIAEL